ncbi:hypothetical protein Kisp01_49870 [Kineosporia sp. NBRC 101677]|uniref:META domain-containing protein n=1 Tax=Kineosporia sp. NBRC 101677 TaxID=3032197 RepID=UPI0024A28B0E|nr:META domain-containing protein [Kineosporia sp. NBRC 101677]GLY17973.1 hypothetical protein Kisp01_49870 [Kineosporia sp. NBRC 101677]
MSQKLRTAVVGLVLPVLLVTGCGEQGEPVAEGTALVGSNVAEDIVGRWYPLRIEGYRLDPVFADSWADAYLEFDQGEWTGSDGCNGLRGTYDLDAGGAFEQKEMASTEIGCANVPHYDVLDRATTVRVEDDTLIFSADEEIARYTRSENPAPTRTDAPSPAASIVQKKTEPDVPPGT